VWLPLEQSVVYFVTACCHQRRRIFEEAENARIGAECLRDIAARYEWNVLNACFMPDHFHMLISPLKEREQKLSGFMQAWKSSVTLRLRQSGIEGEIWQKEFFDRLLRSDESMSEKWAYVVENPLKEGLSIDVESYPFIGTPEEILEKISKAEAARNPAEAGHSRPARQASNATGAARNPAEAGHSRPTNFK